MLLLIHPKEITMRSRIAAGLMTVLLASGCAMSQVPRAGADHAAHHPPGTGAAAAAAPSTPAAAPAPDAFNRQMMAMQEMHQKMQSARSPAERAALMDEHMKTMQSGMAMMGQMRGAGTAMGATGMGSMMDMHMQMERRMAMMEQMMKMMLDREAAMPRK